MPNESKSRFEQGVLQETNQKSISKHPVKINLISRERNKIHGGGMIVQTQLSSLISMCPMIRVRSYCPKTGFYHPFAVNRTTYPQH